jgi:hypothetical protein
MIDEDFKALCDDYITSKINMKKYRDRLQEDVELKSEYEDLSMELEKEIIRYLDKMK